MNVCKKLLKQIVFFQGVNFGGFGGGFGEGWGGFGEGLGRILGEFWEDLWDIGKSSPPMRRLLFCMLRRLDLQLRKKEKNNELPEQNVVFLVFVAPISNE